MKIRVSQATRRQLDWMVAKCERADHLFAGHEVGRLHYTSNWAEGGPIIEREGIGFRRGYSDESGFNGWVAQRWAQDTTVFEEGPTPLIAAMRCYVASKLGDEVEIPEELK